MSDTKDTDENKSRESGGKTLSLRRTVESGHVRQNFSHGRSKSVLVEKKGKRTITPGGGAQQDAPKVEVRSKRRPAAKPAAPKKEEAAPKADAAPSAQGVVLRTLTEEEKDARARAVADARVREAEERKQAEEDRKRREVEEEAARLEREAAEARQAEEVARPPG